MKSFHRLAMLAIGATLGFAPSAGAQVLQPSRNIEMVIGSGAGGAVDFLARLAVKGVESEKLVPNTFTASNKAGAGFGGAVSYLAGHAGDPHYIALLGSGWLTTIIQTRREENFTNVTPIARLFDTPMVFAVGGDSPIKNAKDIVDALKKDPGSLRFAITTSAGNNNHLGALRLGELAGADLKKMRVVVNDAGTVSISQMLGGHIEVCVCSIGSLQPMVKAGQARIIGLATEKRISASPEVPTMREQGVDVLISGFYMLALPRGVTAEQAAFWEKTIKAAVESPVVKEGVASQQASVEYMSTKDTLTFLQAQRVDITKKLNELGLVQ